MSEKLKISFVYVCVNIYIYVCVCHIQGGGTDGAMPWTYYVTRRVEESQKARARDQAHAGCTYVAPDMSAHNCTRTIDSE